MLKPLLLYFIFFFPIGGKAQTVERFTWESLPDTLKSKTIVAFKGEFFERRGPCFRRGDTWTMTRQYGFYIDSVLKGQVGKTEIVTNYLLSHTNIHNGAKYLVLLRPSEKKLQILKESNPAYYPAEHSISDLEVVGILPWKE